MTATRYTKTKAYLATGASLLATFLATLLVGWSDTDPLTPRDFVVALVAALGVAAGTGIATYAGPPNTPRGP